MNDVKSILIAGGGIGGLAASIALQDAGFETHVFEAQDDFSAVGVAVILGPNGMKSLRAIGHGIRDSVYTNGRPMKANGPLLIVDTDGQQMGTRDLPDLEAEFGEPLVIIRRKLLHKFLVGAQREGSLHASKELVGLNDDGSQVTAEFADGTTATGDILIGADGLNSVVRKVLHGTTAPRYAGYGNLRGLLTTVELPADYPQGLAVVEGERHVLVQPLGDGGAYVSSAWPMPVGEWPRDPKLAQAYAAEQVKGWYFVEDVIPNLAPDTLVAREIRDHHPIPSWAVGRVSLLGDAAHAMTNFWGQGANSALEDAVILARCFKEADDGLSALAAYERARIGRTTLLQTASARTDLHAADPTEFQRWCYEFDAATSSLEPDDIQLEDLVELPA